MTSMASTTLQLDWPTSIGLRSNDWVQVRSAREILQTLDDRGCLDGLPFQPEMLAYCGQHLRVDKVAHKTCDTVHKTGGRRMRDAVHLAGARCDGSGHDGCMADCVFFWKEAWLRRENEPAASAGVARLTEQDIHRLARRPDDPGETGPTYVCQTTALFEATEPLHWWDIRQYVRDVTSGNHRALHMLKLIVFAGFRKLVQVGIGYRLLVGGYNRLQRWRGGKPYPQGAGAIPDGQPTPTERLDLQVGEWVEIKPQEEILATITVNGFNRGMRYDMEMSQYAGERHRVQMRVERLINEQTGKMIPMKTPCIQLEDVYCRATCTEKRLGCPRASNTYWREIWLRRVDGPHAK